MEMIAKLLAQREQEGLRQLFIAGLVIAGVSIVMNIFLLPDTPVRNLRLVGWGLPVGATLIALWLLSTNRPLPLAGSLFILLAVSYSAFAAYTNYLTLDHERFSAAAILFVTDVPGIALVIAATALTLRPAYPIATAVCLVGMYCVFLIFALSDPQTKIGTDYASMLSEPVVLPTREASNTVYVLLIGGVVAAAVHNARQTVLKAVDLEVKNRDLSRYFSPNVVARITSRNRDAASLGGVRQDVVILFSDLAGFTALSSRLQPEEALALLSEYRGHMVDAIFDHSGTLDKFLGDGIMATFGTADPDPDAAHKSVQAAFAMEAGLERLNDKRIVRGLEPLSHRIGIHAGPALVGNVGTDKRLEFTVIGPSVNVASRVEHACKELGESLLVSASVQARAAASTNWRAVDKIPVDGRSEGLMLFAPDGITA